MSSDIESGENKFIFGLAKWRLHRFANHRTLHFCCLHDEGTLCCLVCWNTECTKWTSPLKVLNYEWCPRWRPVSPVFASQMPELPLSNQIWVQILLKLWGRRERLWRQLQFLVSLNIISLLEKRDSWYFLREQHMCASHSVHPAVLIITICIPWLLANKSDWGGILGKWNGTAKDQNRNRIIGFRGQYYRNSVAGEKGCEGNCCFWCPGTFPLAWRNAICDISGESNTCVHRTVCILPC